MLIIIVNGEFSQNKLGPLVSYYAIGNAGRRVSFFTIILSCKYSKN